jgi:cell division septation protein DedD
MTDIRADEPTPLDDEDRLPWLEAVEEDGEGTSPSPAKLIAFVVIGLIAIGLIVGGLFWMGNRDGAANREAELIEAPEGAVKVKPDDPGGMQVQGKGDTSFATSEGADPSGNIDVSAVPEAPVQPKAAPVAVPAPTPVPPRPAPTPAVRVATPAIAPGASIQLGAFSSQAGANNAWKGLSSRFKYLAPLTHSITPVTAGGKTLYRLRASGMGADDFCGRLRVAGETCVSLD